MSNSYTWNGTSFGGTVFVPSGFYMSITNSVSSVYFYEQNYNAFYSPVITNGVPLYTGGLSVTVPKNTVLYVDDFLIPYVTDFNVQIILNRYELYLANEANLLNAATQTPGSLVQQQINSYSQSITGGVNGYTATVSGAPLLTSPCTNFIFNEISQNWSGGQQAIKSLGNVMSAASQFSGNVTKAISKITDFKNRLIESQARIADGTQQLQGQTNQYSQQNTFGAMAAALPCAASLAQSLGGIGGMLAQQLIDLMPTGNVSVQDALNAILPAVISGGQPQIVNPIDKLLVDVQSMENGIFNEIISLVNAPLASVVGQASSIFQYSAITANIINQLPVTPTIPAPAPITGTQNVNNALSNPSSAIYSAFEMQVAALSGQNITQAVAALYGQNSNPSGNNAFTGGSFANVLSGLGNIVTDDFETMLQPYGLSLTPDATFQSQQTAQTIAQNQANAPGTQVSLQRGDSINNTLYILPIRPRSTLLSGDPGDYQHSITYELS